MKLSKYDGNQRLDLKIKMLWGGKTKRIKRVGGTGKDKMRRK